MYVQPQIQQPSLENLVWHQQHFTMAGNASAAFATSLLRASTSLSNHFFNVPLSDREPPAPLLPPPKTPVMSRTIVEIGIDRAVSIKNMVLPCSLNKARILSNRDVSLSRIFSMVCLILATCI